MWLCSSSSGGGGGSVLLGQWQTAANAQCPNPQWHPLEPAGREEDDRRHQLAAQSGAHHDLEPRLNGDARAIPPYPQPRFYDGCHIRRPGSPAKWSARLRAAHRTFVTVVFFGEVLAVLTPLCPACVSSATVSHGFPRHHTDRHDGIWHGQWNATRHVASVVDVFQMWHKAKRVLVWGCGGGEGHFFL